MADVARRKFGLHDSQRPQLKYEQLKGKLLDDFRSGRFKPGDALPTEVQLAEMLGMARNTVRLALSELDRDGFIKRIRGKGTFVSSNTDKLQSQPQSRAKDTSLYALVVPETQTGMYPSLQHGFENAVSEKHAQMIVSSTNNDPVRQSHVMMQLMSKEVGGVAIVPTLVSAPAFQVELLQKQGIPVVFCHRRMEGVLAPLVSIPYLEVGRMAGRELLRCGHRRVAMYYSLPLAYRAQSVGYLSGLRETLGENGAELPDELVLSGETITLDTRIQEKDARPQIEKLFSRPDRPTALMVSYDDVAEMILMVLESISLRVPDDVSIISFGGAERRGVLKQRLTSVVVDGAETGRRAFQLLNEIRDQRRSIFDIDEIPMKLALSEGQTLGPACI